MLIKVLAACFVVAFSSTAWSYDIYEWRAGTEAMCNQGYQALKTPILQSMAGGRPEKLVVKKIIDEGNDKGLSANVGVDIKTASIIIRSLVHSMITDKRLSDPLNLSIESYKEMFKRCSKSILKYDPDGSKTEAWRNRDSEVELSDVVLARVNDNSITVSDFKYQFKDLSPQMQQAVVMDPKAGAEFLEDLIGIELVIQEAKRQGIDREAEYKKRQKQLKIDLKRQIIEEAKNDKPKEQLKKELERRVQKEAMNDLFNSLLKKELGEKMAGIMPTTDKEVADYFDQNMEMISKAAGKKIVLKDVEQQLKMRITQGKRREMYLDYAKGLKAKAEISIDGKLLDTVVSSLTKNPTPAE